MGFLRESCGTKNTVCVFEAVKESLLGFPLMPVSAVIFNLMSHCLRDETKDLRARW